jgi:electron transfer flavoprotein alpha subunit
VTGAPRGPAIAVVVARQGHLPAGADETVAEAGGQAVIVGSGAEEAAASLASASCVWWTSTGTGPAGIARRLAPVLAPLALIVLPASPDGRDLAPRLAATLGWPLLAGAVRVGLAEGRPDGHPGVVVAAELLRVDGRVVVPLECDGPAVATLLPGARAPAPTGSPAGLARLETPAADRAAAADPEVLAVIEPDPATMDLAEATRVLAGGAGLAPRGVGDAAARAVFALLADTAAALGASMGATRAVIDAGWTGPERQIGTTGVAVDPDLYIALGVSGATQHTSGLGSPRHIVSVNIDPACPMTAMADLGLVTDAAGLLIRLAERLGVELPAELKVPGA